MSLAIVLFVAGILCLLGAALVIPTGGRVHLGWLGLFLVSLAWLAQ